jgi:hypothetical protein
VTDLAEIPAKFGVWNVYAELGTCFANTSITHPRPLRRCLALYLGPGSDKESGARIQSGTVRRNGRSRPCGDSRFRTTCRKHGYARSVPRRSGQDQIFSGNAARMYNVDVQVAVGAISIDQISTAKAMHREMNEGRSISLRLRRKGLALFPSCRGD